MIEHAWIAPKGFVKLTKIYVLWYCCEYAHLISSRTPLKLLLAVGLPLWLLVFFKRKQRRTASDVAVLSHAERSAAQDFRGGRRPRWLIIRCKEQQNSHASDDVTLCL
jgi:hypothetical protein